MTSLSVDLISVIQYGVTIKCTAYFLRFWIINISTNYQLICKPVVVKFLIILTSILVNMSCNDPFGPPADKRDLTTKSENFKVMHILQILSM